jgi:regulation of enolase protein 1 (concanavalin A-like superfamily)
VVASGVLSIAEGGTLGAVAAQDIDEDFDGERPDARLQWWNPPRQAELRESRLVVTPRGGTDLWQRTHYGFRRDDAHCLLVDWPGGDFLLTTTVRVQPVHQYDQAGLIVRLSGDCWLKTSIEYEVDRPNRLGAVVTNAGWSDWSTQDVPQSVRAIRLRVARTGADYIVEAAPIDGSESGWSQLRVAHLAEDDGGSVQCGLYACSPQGEGLIAEFDYVRLRGRS